MKRTMKTYNELGVKTRPEFCCATCGRMLSYTEYTVEHMIPKSWGGSNVKCNLCLLCSSCNVRKGDSIPKSAVKTYPYLRAEHILTYTTLLISNDDIRRERMNTSHYEMVRGLYKRSGRLVL